MTSLFGSTRTGDALHRDHQATLSTLDRLESLIDTPPQTPLPGDVRGHLAAIAASLREDVTDHFSYEETHLFPLVSAAGATFMVDMLTGEHEILRPLAERLIEITTEVLAADTFSSAQWKEFCSVGNSLIEMESFHIQKEEMGLLAALGQVLSPEEDETLAGYHDRLQAFSPQ